MDKPVLDFTPLTDEESRQTADVMEKIEALIHTLSPRVEYNITVGGHHLHNGSMAYLLMTVGELLATACHSMMDKGATAILPLIMVQAHIVRIIGPAAVDVAKKYGMKFDEPVEDEAVPESRLGFHTEGDANA